MRLLFIFSIFCVLAAYGVQSETQKVQYSIARFVIKECLNEFDTAIKQINKSRDFSKKSNTDATCLYACGLRKWSQERGSTLSSGLLEMIDEAYKSNFHITKFTRNDIVSKVERCLVKESNECEFAKCVGIFEPPFSNVYVHYITHTQSTP